MQLVLHHYVLKSRAEFASKKARGSGAGNVKEWSFFNYMDNLSNSTCTWGENVSKAFFASKPRLRPPRGPSHPCSLRSKQLATAAAAATAPDGVLAAAGAAGFHGQAMQRPDVRKQRQPEQGAAGGDAADAAGSEFAEQE